MMNKESFETRKHLYDIVDMSTIQMTMGMILYSTCFCIRNLKKIL
jgi:hypothetical protein